MITAFVQSFALVRAVNSTLLHRARTERGASMTEYALLIGLIAIVAVAGLLILGPAIESLFATSGNCVASPTTNCL